MPRTFLHFPDKVTAPGEPDERLYLFRFIENTETNNTHFILLHKHKKKTDHFLNDINMLCIVESVVFVKKRQMIIRMFKRKSTLIR